MILSCTILSGCDSTGKATEQDLFVSRAILNSQFSILNLNE
jgi:hypothetical protein